MVEWCLFRRRLQFDTFQAGVDDGSFVDEEGAVACGIFVSGCEFGVYVFLVGESTVSSLTFDPFLPFFFLWGQAPKPPGLATLDSFSSSFILKRRDYRLGTQRKGESVSRR